MKRELLDILVCPACRGKLALHVAQERETEIMQGALTCSQCGVTYPIEDAIPNLLPPHLRPQAQAR